MDARLQTSRFVKQAGPPTYAEVVGHKQDAGRYIASIIAASLGAGVLGRTFIGANRMLRKPFPVSPSLAMQPMKVPVKEEEKTEPKYAALRKTAVTDDNTGMLQHIGNMIAKNLWHTSPANFKANPNFMLGDMAKHWTSVPAALPLALGGGLGAAYGGYKATDAILDARRKSEMEDELQTAKRNYEQAVQQRLKIAERIDNVSASVLLDELATVGVLKQANWLSDLTANAKSLGATGLGMYLTYALMSGLGAGKLTHDITRKNTPRSITEKALNERARKRYGMTPPMYISQQPKPAITS